MTGSWPTVAIAVCWVALSGCGGEPLLAWTKPEPCARWAEPPDTHGYAEVGGYVYQESGGVLFGLAMAFRRELDPWEGDADIMFSAYTYLLEEGLAPGQTEGDITLFHDLSGVTDESYLDYPCPVGIPADVPVRVLGFEPLPDGRDFGEAGFFAVVRLQSDLGGEYSIKSQSLELRVAGDGLLFDAHMDVEGFFETGNPEVGTWGITATGVRWQRLEGDVLVVRAPGFTWTCQWTVPPRPDWDVEDTWLGAEVPHNGVYTCEETKRGKRRIFALRQGAGARFRDGVMLE